MLHQSDCRESDSRPHCCWEPIAGPAELQDPRGTPWDPQGDSLQDSSIWFCSLMHLVTPLQTPIPVLLALTSVSPTPLLDRRKTEAHREKELPIPPGY